MSTSKLCRGVRLENVVVERCQGPKALTQSETLKVIQTKNGLLSI